MWKHFLSSYFISIDILDLWDNAYGRKSDHDNKFVLLLVLNNKDDNNINNQLEQQNVDPLLQFEYNGGNAGNKQKEKQYDRIFRLDVCNTRQQENKKIPEIMVQGEAKYVPY